MRKQVDIKTIEEETIELTLGSLREFPYLETLLFLQSDEAPEVYYEIVEGMTYGSLWEDYIVEGNLELELVKERLLIHIETLLSVNLSSLMQIDNTAQGLLIEFELKNKVGVAQIRASHNEIEYFETYGDKNYKRWKE